MIASGASVRKSLDRFSDSLAARMYENAIIIGLARWFAMPKVGTVGLAHGLATTPNDSVVIPFDRRGRSSVTIHTYEMRLRRSRVLAPH